MAEEQDRKTTFSLTNSSKEHFNAEQILHFKSTIFHYNKHISIKKKNPPMSLSCAPFTHYLFKRIYSLTCAALSHSAVSDSLQPHGLQPSRLLCLWGFSRQEYSSGMPCNPPGDLPNPGIEPRSATVQADSVPSKPPGKPFTNLGLGKEKSP